MSSLYRLIAFMIAAMTYSNGGLFVLFYTNQTAATLI